MSRPSKVTAFMQLARLSNLPTVFSNTLVGAALGARAESLPLQATTLAAFAISLFYAGGMALNDVMDRRIDAEERPNRPIPSGVITVEEALFFVVLSFVAGFILLAFSGPTTMALAAALIAAIILYDILHKHWGLSLIFMGLCRGLVYMTVAALVAASLDQPLYWLPLALFALLITIYIIGLTVVAQKEAAGNLGFRRWLALALVVVPFIALLFTSPSNWLLSIPAGFILALWLLRSNRMVRANPPRVMPAVLGWLSGICLIDAFFLCLMGSPLWACAAGLCFIATVFAHKRILGT